MKPIDVFDKLVSLAIIHRYNARSRMKPGGLLEKLSIFDRELLKDLKSDEVTKHHWIQYDYPRGGNAKTN